MILLNLLFDDLGKNHLKIYNQNALASTPNLEGFSLAANVATKAHTCGVVCSPTRVAMLTGLPPSASNSRHVWNGNTELGVPIETPTIAERLSSANVKTYHFGKWHSGPIRNAVACGFDYAETFQGKYYHGTTIWQETPNQDPVKVDEINKQEHATGRIINRCIEAIQNHDVNQDAFFNLWLLAPHKSPHDTNLYSAPQEYLDEYPDTNDGHYLALLEYIDSLLGLLFAALPSDAKIIISSDNGSVDPANGGYYDPTKTSRGFKDTQFAGGNETPLITNLSLPYPDKYITTIDIATEICNTFNADTSGMIGQVFSDLTPRLVMNETLGGRSRTGNHNKDSLEFLVTDGRYTLITEARDDAVTEAFYDTLNDPNQINDLAPHYLATQFKDAFLAERRVRHSLPFEPLNTQFQTNASKRIFDLDGVTKLSFDSRHNFHDGCYTFSFLVRLNSLPDEEEILIGKSGSWILTVDNLGVLKFKFNEIVVSSSELLSVGTLNRFVLSIKGWPASGCDVKAWLNSNECMAFETQDNFINNSDESIEFGNDYLSGIIRDVRFYNMPLSLEEVLQEPLYTL